MRILVAEDDPITREALTACIGAEGYETLSAGNGADALALWRKHRPDLLCLDIMMPGLDGFELCRQIRAHDTSTPILFLSAKNEEVDVVVGLEIGADDFIRKPFTRGEVMARIRLALRRARPAGEARRCLQMHELNVWPGCELRAERDGTGIELTPREAAMLALLHEQSGRPVSRDAFLDRCWGMDYFPDSRTLDQHIVALRKKIERQPSRPRIIETVRGVGYRFRPQ